MKERIIVESNEKMAGRTYQITSKWIVAEWLWQQGTRIDLVHKTSRIMGFPISERLYKKSSSWNKNKWLQDRNISCKTECNEICWPYAPAYSYERLNALRQNSDIMEKNSRTTWDNVWGTYPYDLCIIVNPKTTSKVKAIKTRFT